jgi:hypothetical protein
VFLKLVKLWELQHAWKRPESHNRRAPALEPQSTQIEPRG